MQINNELTVRDQGSLRSMKAAALTKAVVKIKGGMRITEWHRTGYWEVYVLLGCGWGGWGGGGRAGGCYGEDDISRPSHLFTIHHTCLLGPFIPMQ